MHCHRYDKDFNHGFFFNLSLVNVSNSVQNSVPCRSTSPYPGLTKGVVNCRRGSGGGGNARHRRHWTKVFDHQDPVDLPCEGLDRLIIIGGNWIE